MKHLPIKSESLEYVIYSFKEWLDIQGYAIVTVNAFPNQLREFFHHLETSHNIKQVHQIKVEHFKSYYEKLKMRSNTRQGGALSNAYLNKHIDGLMKFAQYLRKSARVELPYIELDRNEQNSRVPEIVSIEEIKAILVAADQHPNPAISNASSRIYEAIASRDKALLTVLYGCGLRRNECYNLDVSDINFDRRVLHVRKGKNYKERFVPFNKPSAEILQTYIYDYRPIFNKANELSALFVSAKGFRMGHLNTSLRLKILIDRTEIIELKQKNVTLHTLRHSIATHLLQAGMPLEKISRFLGHTSLESTQIYTHLAEQMANR